MFHTWEFFFFFAIVLVLFYAGSAGARRWVLLLASYYFYGAWNPRFLPLLWSLTVVDYFAALWIVRYQGRRRKWALWMSIAANLGFLGFFKYSNFIAANVSWLLGVPQPAFDIVLPLGISFHTFQSISYVVDVYRGEQEVVRDPVDYALFIAFFPQLVAGPIVRAREFFVDYYHWKRPDAGQVQRGVFEMLSGLTKKMALADQFAVLADGYFANPSAHAGALAAWGGVCSFAMQIYFDFSGYTDIAIGAARVMGFHFPDNFRRPYFAGSITEFWRRWHMSLSRWLRDYLYITLGGNRGGVWRTYRNLMLTMLLGGLWHGASWNFVIWGGYHGLLLSVERALGITAGRWWRVPVTFVLVCVGWVFFRARTLGDAWFVLGEMMGASGGEWAVPLWLAALAGFGLLLPLRAVRERWMVAYGLVLLLILELFGVTDLTVPFVYFQF
ncbi:MAG: MBOAT family protein [Acidobacteria bacterium]|nr:MBOAT family protein [Acidobacteriota bacterium]